MSFRRLIAIAGVFLCLSACLPGMGPVGSPANPAGIKGSTDGGSDSSVDDASKSPSAPPDEADRPGVFSSPFGGSNAGSTTPPDAITDGSASDPNKEAARQFASGGGGFAPKPDEANVGDPELAKDWKALSYRDGAWSELSKTESTYLPSGATAPITLRLDVQQYAWTTKVIAGMAWTDVLPGRTVRLILKPYGGDETRYQMVDAKTLVCEAEGCGFNTEFRDLTVPEGLIEVYLYWGDQKEDGTFEAPPSDYASFMKDPKRRYLGAFTTKASLQERLRRNGTILKPSHF
jgi:hypothetical protein